MSCLSLHNEEANAPETDFDLDGMIYSRLLMRLRGPHGQHVIRVRAFTGGVECPHGTHIQSALITIASKYSVRLDLGFLDSKALKNTSMSETQFVDWLLDSDIHFIVGYLYMGLDRLSWSCTHLNRELFKLAAHPGFPIELELTCPVLTQDKFRYISALKGDCNPTLCIYLRKDSDYLDIESDINRFCDVYTEGKGWILKLPYIANSRIVSCRTRKEIFEELVRLGKQKGREFKLATRDVASYIMLQPRMCNKREIKVACFKGRCRYRVKSCHSRYGFKWSGSNDEDATLYPFVEDVIRKLKRVCHGFVDDGVLRVDVFENSSGKLVVNEIESLDAVLYDTASRASGAEPTLNSDIRCYWYGRVQSIFDKMYGK